MYKSKIPLYLHRKINRTVMTQIILNISRPSLVSSLKEILQAIDGVTIDKVISGKEQSGIMKSLQDVKDGNVERFASVDDLMEDLMR
jgi:predicted AAA+ superfamily ATPase